jgi:cation/acetate symporter
MTLSVPEGKGMWNFLALTFCLMVGTAGLPHILTRYYTTPSVKQARTSVGWSLFFIFLLYFTAPAYAAFARFAAFTNLVGSKISELPGWVKFWQPAGLFTVVDKNGDGIVQWADFVIRSTDFVVLSMPEVAGLPFTITGLVMAGGLAAALSTADGLLLTIANAISHDLYYNVIDHTASLTKRLTITKILLIVTAVISAWVATFRFAVIAELVAWAFSLAGASFFPALVMGIWWKRANKQGAVWGMSLGLIVTTYYLIGSRFFIGSTALFWAPLQWIWNATGTLPIAAAIWGLPVGFLVIWIVSLLTAPPPKAVMDLVESVRYPKSGQMVKGDPLGRDLREAPVH